MGSGVFKGQTISVTGYSRVFKGVSPFTGYSRGFQGFQGLCSGHPEFSILKFYLSFLITDLFNVCSTSTNLSPYYPLYAASKNTMKVSLWWTFFHKMKELDIASFYYFRCKIFHMKTASTVYFCVDFISDKILRTY